MSIEFRLLQSWPDFSGNLFCCRAAKGGEPMQDEDTPMSAASAQQGALQPEETGHSFDVPKTSSSRSAMQASVTAMVE